MAVESRPSRGISRQTRRRVGLASLFLTATALGVGGLIDSKWGPGADLNAEASSKATRITKITPIPDETVDAFKKVSDSYAREQKRVIADRRPVEDTVILEVPDDVQAANRIVRQQETFEAEYRNQQQSNGARRREIVDNTGMAFGLIVDMVGVLSGVAFRRTHSY